MKTTDTLNSGNVKTLTKEEVQEILNEGCFECSYRMGGSDRLEPYEGCDSNLYMILEDESTTVAEAELGHADYQPGYRTVMMNAPCFPAVILLRAEE